MKEKIKKMIKKFARIVYFLYLCARFVKTRRQARLFKTINNWRVLYLLTKTLIKNEKTLFLIRRFDCGDVCPRANNTDCNSHLKFHWLYANTQSAYRQRLLCSAGNRQVCLLRNRYAREFYEELCYFHG